MSDPLIFLIFAGFGFYIWHSQEQEKRKSIDRVTTSLQENYEELLNGSKADLLAWACDRKGAVRRKMKRKEHLRREGKQDRYFRGGGYIYVVACKPMHISNLKFNGNYRNRKVGNFKVQEPPGFWQCIKAAEDIFINYPLYHNDEEAPYKIGYTTKDPINRIKQLNNSDEINYANWKFDEVKYESVWLDKSIEYFENEVHWALRKKSKEVIGEIFCASWNEIQNVIKNVTGKKLPDCNLLQTFTEDDHDNIGLAESNSSYDNNNLTAEELSVIAWAENYDGKIYLEDFEILFPNFFSESFLAEVPYDFSLEQWKVSYLEEIGIRYILNEDDLWEDSLNEDDIPF